MEQEHLQDTREGVSHTHDRDMNWLAEINQNIEKRIAEVLVGQQKAVQLLTNALITNGHVLLEGVPGVGKTLLAKLFAHGIDASFKRIQFTPDLMPSDIIGTSIFNQKLNEFEFKKGPAFTQVLMIDEINRAPAKTQSALFELMQEQQISIDGQRYELEDPFMVLATQNPIEQEGTYALPEAQLDRFAYKIMMGYPDPEEEFALLQRFQHQQKAGTDISFSPVVNPAQIAKMRSVVSQVFISKELMQFIAEIGQRTRNNRHIFLGASPRASLVLMHGAKAAALMAGRDFVIPEDITALLVPVLAHRLQLNAVSEMEGYTIASVLEELIQELEIPR